MRVRSLATPLLVASLCSACAINPVTGQPEFVLMSSEREAAVGQQASQEVAQQIGLIDDASLSEYVNAVGQRVAKHSPRQEVPYHFAVVDMPEPNAFALPGGYVYVSRGLLAITNSEAELANVLGHEVGHVAARHAAHRETQQLGVGILSAIGTVAAGILGGAGAAQAVGQLGQVAGAGMIASYSRDQEREADRVGQQMAAAAGYDPAAMGAFLRTLEQEVRLEAGESRRPGFLDSHPSTPERVAATEAFARTLRFTPVADIARDRADLYARFDGLLVGANPAEGVFRGETFLHPEFDLRIRFPEGWRTQNSRAAVVGGSPQQDALIALELQGRGDDPKAGAAAFVNAQKLAVQDSGELRVGNLPAYHAVALADTQQGRLAVDITWIAYRGALFRVTGLTPPGSYNARAAEIRGVARSFRPLTAEERASIEERRLRAIRARAGESLDALADRTSSAWNVQEIAVANAIPAAAPLEDGQPVKITLDEPFRSDGEPALEPASDPLGER